MFGPGPTNGVDCPVPAVQGEPIKLPTPIGNKVKVTEKVYAPIKDHPKVNYHSPGLCLNYMYNWIGENIHLRLVSQEQ